MNIGIMGGEGQLGQELATVYTKESHQVHRIKHSECDVSDQENVKNFFEQHAYDLVIMTAAYHNVEECEKFPKVAMSVNSLGAHNLAVETAKNNTDFVYVSTDYVFSGNTNIPYTEDDLALPSNVYGESKLSGENLSRIANSKSYIVRVSGLYGSHWCRGKNKPNFVDLMIKLSKERDEISVVDSQFVSPTYTKYIAENLVQLTNSKKYGLYHMACKDFCSWYDFAKAVFDIKKIKTNLKVASPEQFYSEIKRPDFSALKNKNLDNINLNFMPHWRDALEDYLGSHGDPA